MSVIVGSAAINVDVSAVFAIAACIAAIAAFRAMSRVMRR